MDKNSKYFHVRANRRKARNKIDALLYLDETWCSDKGSLENLLRNHFQNIMSTSTPTDSYYFLEHTPSLITDADNQELEAAPTDEEIYKALMTMDPWTSPGPDSFPPGFYQTQWETVKGDVCNMMRSFFHSGFLLKELNKTRISLIPKVKYPSRPEDFRPIALCNIVYKIISKVISLRMKKHITRLISPMKDAYVPGRLISENVCLVQEIVQAMKRKEGRTGHLALKMDMSKAFDRLEWSFLIDVLKKFGFGDKFCQLIHQCVSTTQIEVLLNGSPTKSFTLTRGIRQEDPLSPYLFILAM